MQLQSRDLALSVVTGGILSNLYKSRRERKISNVDVLCLLCIVAKVYRFRRAKVCSLLSHTLVSFPGMFPLTLPGRRRPVVCCLCSPNGVFIDIYGPEAIALKGNRIENLFSSRLFRVHLFGTGKIHWEIHCVLASSYQ